MTQISRVFAVLIFLFTLHVTQADEIRWIQANGGDWHNSANWDLGRAPTEWDDVIIEQAGDYTVTVNAPVLVGSARVGGATSGKKTFDLRASFSCTEFQVKTNGELKLISGDFDAGNLYIDGIFDWNGGNLTYAGLMTLVTSNGVINIKGDTAKHAAGTLENRGTIHWNSAPLQGGFYLENYARFIVLTNCDLGDTTFYSEELDWETQAIELPSNRGVSTFYTKAYVGGWGARFLVGSGSTLVLQGRPGKATTYTIDQFQLFHGTGTVKISTNAILSGSAEGDLEGILELDGGVLNAWLMAFGARGPEAAFVWRNGKIVDAGIGGDVAIRFEGDADRTIDRGYLETWDTYEPLVWNCGGTIYLTNGSEINLHVSYGLDIRSRCSWVLDNISSFYIEGVVAQYSPTETKINANLENASLELLRGSFENAGYPPMDWTFPISGYQPIADYCQVLGRSVPNRGWLSVFPVPNFTPTNGSEFVLFAALPGAVLQTNQFWGTSLPKNWVLEYRTNAIIARVSDPSTVQISVQPQSTVVNAGSGFGLSVQASGTNLQYQWLHNGVALGNGPSVSGALSSNLHITGVSKAHAGPYSVLVSNGGSSMLSREAIVRVRVPQKVHSASISAGNLLLTIADADGSGTHSNSVPFIDLQMSSNLVHWTSLTNDAVLSNGFLRFEQPLASATARFFRIIEQ